MLKQKNKACFTEEAVHYFDAALQHLYRLGSSAVGVFSFFLFCFNVANNHSECNSCSSSVACFLSLEIMPIVAVVLQIYF